MKVTGARLEPVQPARRRAPVGAAGAANTGSAASTETATFLGIPAPEITPSVQAAIQTLLGELDALRTEVLVQCEGRISRRQ